MTYYIDTSALIKVYHLEAGSQKVIDIYNSEEEIIISELSVVEFTPLFIGNIEKKR